MILRTGHEYQIGGGLISGTPTDQLFSVLPVAGSSSCGAEKQTPVHSALPLIRTVLPDCQDVFISSFTKGPVIANCLAIFPNNDHTDEEIQRVFNELVLERSSKLGDIEVLFSTTTTVVPTTPTRTTKNPIDDPGRKPKRPYPCCPPTVARATSRKPVIESTTTSRPTTSGTTTSRHSTESTVNVWTTTSTTARSSTARYSTESQPTTTTGSMPISVRSTSTPSTRYSTSPGVNTVRLTTSTTGSNPTVPLGVEIDFRVMNIDMSDDMHNFTDYIEQQATY
ncbi:uncharacterized protein LOC143788134 [Ranitomeya variabilis]|uniref:uncharacterized protein LOC143788134 n=1 Tax=Ranitomeya variabilis TaxID=490064 RepID=UPI0040577AF1